VATYFLRPEMLEWIGHQLDPLLTPEQVQAAFDALIRRGVLRPMIRGVWELETSDPELLWWIGAHDSR
jgi:predicted oxidoreductase